MVPITGEKEECCITGFLEAVLYLPLRLKLHQRSHGFPNVGDWLPTDIKIDIQFVCLAPGEWACCCATFKMFI